MSFNKSFRNKIMKAKELETELKKCDCGTSTTKHTEYCATRSNPFTYENFEESN